jgi:DNA repair exonuclease SbcCD nuclease subunit
MKLLLTSDTQAEFANLDYCEQSMQELLAAATKHKPDAIFHLGDLKEAYNPVDARVIKFWVRWAITIRESGYRFIVLRGNHDRISQASDSKDWLDILAAAGVETVSTPKYKSLGNGVVALLPYTGDKGDMQRWAKQLAKGIKARLPRPAALLFHAEIRGGRFNSAGTMAGGGLTTDELECDAYDICVGGHFHGYQRVGGLNVFYAGSPFCQDWGEANEKKGHVLVTVDDTGAAHIQQLVTKIPHWYDADYLEVHGIKPEEGAYIRSRVEVTSKKITDKLREEENRLRKQYGEGMRLFVVPNLIQAPDAVVSITGDTDRERVEQYVAATLPEGARYTAGVVTGYLSSRLGERGQEAACRALTFEKATAQNVLTFQDVEVSYRKQGLVLLRGINRDWPKQSNGSGKTSTLSLLPIALYGQTLKGQKHDAWACENNDDPAVVGLTLVNEKGQELKIDRRRRPHGLDLWVDGVNQSTGMKSVGKEETQGKIEELTFDRNVLLNSVYIDQTIANGFVFGTQKDRMDLVGKLMDLDRFDAALEKVKRDITANDKGQLENSNQVAFLDGEVSRLRRELEELAQRVEKAAKEVATECGREVNRLVKEHAAIMAVKDTYDEKQRQVDDWKEDLRQEEKREDLTAGTRNALAVQRKIHKRLAEEGKCYVCGQETETLGTKMLEADQAVLTTLEEKIRSIRQSQDGIRVRIVNAEGQIERWQDKVREVEGELRVARGKLAQATAAATVEQIRNAGLTFKRFGLTVQLVVTERQMKAAREMSRDLAVDREMLEYAKKAMSRNGMPMYLAASMCKMLNKAAEEFADLFNGGKLKVHFEVRDEQFQVDVINPAGSARTDGQSVGESAMAGIITAFALREAAPKTNLLVLDEPGHGLDPEGARAFGRGLLKLKDRYETILVTTHNREIEAVLSGEKIWTVEKIQGVSTLARE